MNLLDPTKKPTSSGYQAYSKLSLVDHNNYSEATLQTVMEVDGDPNTFVTSKSINETNRNSDYHNLNSKSHS